MRLLVVSGFLNIYPDQTRSDSLAKPSFRLSDHPEGRSPVNTSAFVGINPTDDE